MQAMHALRHAAAGLVAAVAVALAASAVLAVAIGGFVLEGMLYAAFAVLLGLTARRVRPPRRFVFARR
jgi:hypothetical protein